MVSDGTQISEITEGIVKITSMDKNNISGDFEFYYNPTIPGEHSIEAHNGHFYDLPLLSKQLSAGQNFEKTKFMYLDTKTGEIEIKETSIKGSFDKKHFKLNIAEFPNYDLNLNVQNIDFTPFNIILHINENSVKSVFINKINKKGITILFSNGKNLSLF